MAMENESSGKKDIRYFFPFGRTPPTLEGDINNTSLIIYKTIKYQQKIYKEDARRILNLFREETGVFITRENFHELRAIYSKICYDYLEEKYEEDIIPVLRSFFDEVFNTFSRKYVDEDIEPSYEKENQIFFSHVLYNSIGIIVYNQLTKIAANRGVPKTAAMSNSRLYESHLEDTFEKINDLVDSILNDKLSDTNIAILKSQSGKAENIEKKKNICNDIFNAIIEAINNEIYTDIETGFIENKTIGSYYKVVFGNYCLYFFKYYAIIYANEVFPYFKPDNTTYLWSDLKSSCYFAGSYVGIKIRPDDFSRMRANEMKDFLIDAAVKYADKAEW